MDTLLSETSALLPSSLPSLPPPPLRSSHVPAAASSSSLSTACSASTPHAQPLSRPAPPLPLPPSRSLIPSPLEFLWFRGSEPKRRDSEPLDLSLDLLSEATAADRFGEVSDDGWSCTCGDDSNSQIQPADGYQDQIDEAYDVVAPAVSVSVGEDPSSVGSSEVLPATSDQQLEAARGGAAKGWISRFLDLKSFWKDLRSEQSSAVDRLAGAQSENAESYTLQGAYDFTSVCDLPGCLLEDGLQKVVHDKESVSAFLHEVPVFELETISDLCTLSNLAYVIPRINARELFKRHRLRFITSSLEKKAEADVQAKDRSTTKNKGVKRKERETVGNSIAASVGESFTFDPVGAPKSKTGTLKAEHMAATNFPAGKILQEAETVLNEPCTRHSSQVEPVASSKMVTVVESVEAKQSSSNKQASSVGNCPCEWFISDDQSTHTRYLSIQGSETLASWQTNLAFDPTEFEKSGILVHRGVYEAAKALYEMVLPEVLDHLRAHGELAQLRFTGHSLGGGLVTLLALMLLIRGVIKPSALLPIVTFGAPYVLCGGDHLLQKLNLKRNHFLSVIMHRDIVPRVFSCDYPGHIAQILKSLNGTFREHPCLNHQKLLYAPMGQMVILQPDPSHSPGHPLLPSGVGSYFIRHPSNEQDRSNTIQLAGAQRAFMNIPHPLEMLRDPGAYWSTGAICRDHDPRSYRKAMEVVTRMSKNKMRRIHRALRKQLLWPPLVNADASLRAQKAGVNTEINPIAAGAASPALSETSQGWREMVPCATAERCGFPRSNTCLSRTTRNRYARLIASRHVHVGLLLILSTRLINLPVFASFPDWT